MPYPNHTKREAAAVDAWKHGHQLIEWHSMACTCESCLNADALVYIYIPVIAPAYPKADVRGLREAKLCCPIPKQSASG